jgi:hypothetical protein
MNDSKQLIQNHILTLVDIGFIHLDARQKNMIDRFSDKYKQKGIPKKIHQEIIKDAKLMILFS